MHCQNDMGCRGREMECGGFNEMPLSRAFEYWDPSWWCIWVGVGDMADR